MTRFGNARSSSKVSSKIKITLICIQIFIPAVAPDNIISEKTYYFFLCVFKELHPARHWNFHNGVDKEPRLLKRFAL